MRRTSPYASEPCDMFYRAPRARHGPFRASTCVAARALVVAMLSIVLSAILPSASAARSRAAAEPAEPQSNQRRWMAHLLRDHPEMKCTQIPEKPVIIGGDGGGVGKPLEDFLKDSKAVTFGPTDSEGNSDAERLSGLDDIIVDVMAWAKRTLYEPDDMPMDLQADIAKHLCDMFARKEKCWRSAKAQAGAVRGAGRGLVLKVRLLPPHPTPVAAPAGSRGAWSI